MITTRRRSIKLFSCPIPTTKENRATLMDQKGKSKGVRKGVMFQGTGKITNVLCSSLSSPLPHATTDPTQGCNTNRVNGDVSMSKGDEVTGIETDPLVDERRSPPKAFKGIETDPLVDERRSPPKAEKGITAKPLVDECRFPPKADSLMLGLRCC